MGATVVAMSSSNDKYDIAWVGDSRAYRLRNNQLELLTRDHSYLEWLKDNGIVHGVLLSVTGMMSCFVLGYLSSFIFSVKSKDIDGLTIYTLR